MKGKSKIIVSTMGVLLGLLIATSLVLFYVKINTHNNASKSSQDYKITVGEKVKPAYLRRIDQLLNAMEFDKKEILAPKKMNIDDDALVKISLRLANSIEVLKLSIVNEALKVGAKVTISDRMAVVLSGDNFTISQKGPAEQEINRFQQTDWKWEIQPNKTGSLHMRITLIVIYEVDGKFTSRAIKSLDKVIEITDSDTN